MFTLTHPSPPRASGISRIPAKSLLDKARPASYRPWRDCVFTHLCLRFIAPRLDIEVSQDKNSQHSRKRFRNSSDGMSVEPCRDAGPKEVRLYERPIQSWRST
jgi:hypothetical protein